MSVLNVPDLPIEEVRVHVPDLGELAAVLERGLKANFQRVVVSAVQCPDLTRQPYHLVAGGLCGETRVVDVGGPPYLLPLARKDKIYDLAELAKRFGYERALVIGAGAGPWPHIGTNCEGVYNLLAQNGVALKNESRTSRVNVQTGDYVVETLPLDQAKCALLANLLYTKGEPGQVIELECETRTGEKDLISCMRHSLADHYTPKDQTVAVGGVFVLERGSARQHVMPDFSKAPLHTDADVDAWLRFYDMPAPLVAVGTMASRDAGLDLRIQHFHSASPAQDCAGHYHWDTTPETVKYRGCFVPAQYLTRVDRPTQTHNVGRD